jgi:hypothetical protein
VEDRTYRWLSIASTPSIDCSTCSPSYTAQVDCQALGGQRQAAAACCLLCFYKHLRMVVRMVVCFIFETVVW